MKKGFLDKFGYTLTELLLVASIVGVVPITVYLEAAKQARTVSCMSNLRNIYIGIQMYELDHEKLPDAKFYPKSPKTDPKSIMNILRSYVDDINVYICPSLPAELMQSGLTYIWNDVHNNKTMDQVPNKSSEWALTEMSAVEPKIPPPHQGGYNVLFFDGHAVTMKEAVHLTPAPADLEDDIDVTIFARKEYEWHE